MDSSRLKTVIGASFIAMLMHSFCCVMPLVIVLGGLSGAASTLSWIEPAEPYLMGFSIVALVILSTKCTNQNLKSIAIVKNTIIKTY